MKILIFSTLYYPNIRGGGEISTQILAEGLVKHGMKVVLITIDKKYKEEVLNGVKIYRLPFYNIYWSFESGEQNSIKKILWHSIDSYNFIGTDRIKKILSKEQPNIIHSSTIEDISPYVWKISKNLGFKVIHTLRSYTLLCPNATMFKNNKNCTTQCLSCKTITFPKKVISKYVDTVVGISDFILKKHLEYGYFPNAKQDIIFNPVKIPEIDIKKSLISKKNEIIFGYVGRIETAKGVEFLLEHFPKEYKLFLYGKGEDKYVKKLQKRYKEKQIYFKGFETPKKIYSTIDILIVPSLWNEPFGRIVPEANSYRIPVLVTNRGGLPELVRNGENGYVFDVDNQEDFYSKLELIINCFLKNKCEFNLEPFKEDIIINKYIKTYKEALE
jgi:glycosyltransferase involved in cell wall biosynthesis